MTAPDPVRPALGKVLDHPRRLRVVDEHEVVVVLELLRVQRLVAAEDLLLRLGQGLRIALEGVVDRLRRREELVAAVDDPPLGVQARVAHQRHERVVDLGHPAAERGRGQVHEPLAREGLRQPADLLHQAAGRDRRVIDERLLSDVDELQHGLERNRPRIAVGLRGEELDEAQLGAAAFALGDLDLVGDGADDLDPEAALGELVVACAAAVLRLEARPGVPDLDR